MGLRSNGADGGIEIRIEQHLCQAIVGFCEVCYHLFRLAGVGGYKPTILQVERLGELAQRWYIVSRHLCRSGLDDLITNKLRSALPGGFPAAS